MKISNRISSAAPGLYAQLARVKRLGIIVGNVFDRATDLDLIEDVLQNSRGRHQMECPLCGFVGNFKAYGSPPRWNAVCPSCNSLERQRHLVLVLKTMSLSGSLLHFAPEECIAAVLKKHDVRYRSADLSRKNVDLNLNIEATALPDEQWDVIVCSHVLEHVNDALAIPELHRILKPQGVLIAMVPIVDGCDQTYEDETINTNPLRELHFGQNDHLRIYGADFSQRLKDAGFQVSTHTAFGKEAVKYGLTMGDKVFICRKAGHQQKVG